mgnify:CR=1 FL=1
MCVARRASLQSAYGLPAKPNVTTVDSVKTLRAGAAFLDAEHCGTAEACFLYAFSGDGMLPTLPWELLELPTGRESRNLGVGADVLIMLGGLKASAQGGDGAPGGSPEPSPVAGSSTSIASGRAAAAPAASSGPAPSAASVAAGRSAASRSRGASPAFAARSSFGSARLKSSGCAAAYPARYSAYVALASSATSPDAAHASPPPARAAATYASKRPTGSAAASAGPPSPSPSRRKASCARVRTECQRRAFPFRAGDDGRSRRGGARRVTRPARNSA